MGRVLQKKKNRSSIPKVKHKPKSKKLNIKSNPIVAANWSSKLTLSQNYRLLGLTSKLNSRAGGTESKLSSTSFSTTETQPAPDPLAIASSRTPKTFTPTTTRVVRNPETGAILRVEHAQQPKLNPLGDLLGEESDDDGDDRHEAGHARSQRQGASVGIVPQLELAAALGGKKSRPRMQSQGEQEWIERLVAKWGDDFGRMSRDRRLNPQQQSEGDLRKRVSRWREGRGQNNLINRL